MIRTIFSIVCVCLLPAAGLAEFVIDQATFHETDCRTPALASSDESVTMLAYVIAEESPLMDSVFAQALPTQWTDTQFWPSPKLLGPGSSPAICWSRTGFYVAFNSGGEVRIFHADNNGTWDDSCTTFTPNGSVFGLDLCGVTTAAAGPDVFLVVHTSNVQPYGENHVLFASHSESAWSTLFTVAIENEMCLYPQVTYVPDPSGPRAKVFYLGGEPGSAVLNQITQVPGLGWTTPVIVPGDGVSSPTHFGGKFSLVTHGSNHHHILGLGDQPACPCGLVAHQSYIPGDGWSNSEFMTAQYAYFDWPLSPSIAAGPDGKVHAFWFQLASASDLTPLRKTLEYRVLEDGTWADAGGFLNSPGHGQPFEEQVAISVNPSSFPVLAWTRRDTIAGEPQPQQIWIARQPASSPALEPEISRPALLLSAWPNPFNPQVKIAFEVDQARTVRLGVFDPRGRRVARLLDQMVGTGRTEITWRGKDDTGRNLPSGVYFVRLVSGSEKAVFKLVLAE